jgi:DNA-binding MltR family transcriptional regulator
MPKKGGLRVAGKRVTHNSAYLQESIPAFRREMARETDRGSALVGAAMLEDALAAVIRAYLRGDKGCINELFQQNAPVGTFASKSELARCLGLVDSEIHNDLHVIRKIRNEFAHRCGPANFEEVAIKQLCGSLRLVRSASARNTRQHFEEVVFTLFGWLWWLAELLEEPPSPDFPGPPRIAAALLGKARRSHWETLGGT